MKPFNYSSRISKDAEVKEIKGKGLLTFEIAHKESYKDKDDKWQSTYFNFTVNRWIQNINEAKETAKKIVKDSVVSVEGIPEAQAWIDSKDGTAKCKVVIRASEIKILSKYENQAAQPKQQAQNDVVQDDLPF